MHVDKYEQAWIRLSLFVLVVFILAVFTTSVVNGIKLPTVVQRVDPKTVTTPGVSPWAEPGLREIAPGKYEAYVLAQIWLFTPNEIRVPAGSEVTFYVTSKDVQHGFKISNTNINMMVLPGQVSKLTAHFDKPGTYNIICHEYCGVGHHTMFGQIIVEEPEAQAG
jgi:cytochrome c oxidase subunit 2